MKETQLSGVDLDRAVATILSDSDGFLFDQASGAPYTSDENGNPVWFEPSSNWAQGGPIIEQTGIATRKHRGSNTWYAMAMDDAGDCEMVRWNEYTFKDGERYGKLSYEVRSRLQRFEGDTQLLAAMRCFVARHAKKVAQSRRPGTSFTVPKVRQFRGEPEAAKPEFDQYQQVVVESYNGGDHCAHSPADIHDCGDTLLTFLLVELSGREDCDSFDCALNRLDSAIRQLTEVRSAFEAKLLG